MAFFPQFPAETVTAAANREQVFSIENSLPLSIVIL